MGVIRYRSKEPLDSQNLKKPIADLSLGVFVLLVLETTNKTSDSSGLIKDFCKSGMVEGTRGRNYIRIAFDHD
jgi:hypothetical protein